MPIVGMRASWVMEHLELHLTHGLAAADAAKESSIIGFHLVSGGRVVVAPQAHDLGLGAGDDERAAEAVHAVAAQDVAEAGLAGGHHDEPGAIEVELRRFERGQEALRKTRRMSPRRRRTGCMTRASRARAGASGSAAARRSVGRRASTTASIGPALPRSAQAMSPV